MKHHNFLHNYSVFPGKNTPNAKSCLWPLDV